jgi:hypothetical protein
MRKRKSRSKFAPIKHKFLYRWEDASGKRRTIEAWAKVREATRAVTLVVKPEHVLKSIRRKGVGDTANCSMAICAVDNAEAFPHQVEGHIDWTYTRAFVVSRVDRNGLPSECVVYDHNDDIARLNDSNNGQRKLLRQLEADGPREITLTPKRKRSKVGRPGKGRKKVGTRDVEQRLRGGKLRYAVAQLASEQPTA